MTNPDLTEIITVVDRSASMGLMRDKAISSFNEFLQDQKQVEGRANFTLVLFNTDYEVVYNGAPIDAVDPLNETTYRPMKNTALLDAVGRAVDTVGERLANTPENERPGLVVFCILTDGEENSSKEYTLEQLKEILARQENDYNWQFLYLAAGPEAFRGGFNLGLGHVTTEYAASGAGLDSAYQYASQTVTRMRTQDE